MAPGSHASIKASAETAGGRVAVIEHMTPRGLGSPLHVHHREDEWFCDFGTFMRTLAEPASEPVILPPATEPPDVARLAHLALEYGMEILGPPGIPA